MNIIEQRELLGNQFTIYGDVANPLFLAKDVANWIGYELSNVSKMVKNVDEEEKLTTRTNNTSATFLTEDGLYEVLMQSRKPIAKQFKKQVKIILKDIRKNGMWASDTLLDNPEVLLQIVSKLKEEKDKTNLLMQEINIKNQVIGDLQPKANYVDRILDNKSLMTTTQIAKDYGLSAKTFNKMLHEYKIQFSQGGQWLLYAKYQRNGYTSSTTKEIPRSNGLTEIKLITQWTQKGRLFLYEFLKGKAILPTIEDNKFFS